ncbi:MAG: hypothetical protein NC489_41645, partial [Ruminococcus flavefaciens]|nr:hypothetical protein [Ruminococcus flavefaciens]
PSIRYADITSAFAMLRLARPDVQFKASLPTGGRVGTLDRTLMRDLERDLQDVPDLEAVIVAGSGYGPFARAMAMQGLPVREAAIGGPGQGGDADGHASPDAQADMQPRRYCVDTGSMGTGWIQVLLGMEDGEDMWLYAAEDAAISYRDLAPALEAVLGGRLDVKVRPVPGGGQAGMLARAIEGDLMLWARERACAQAAIVSKDGELDRLAAKVTVRGLKAGRIGRARQQAKTGRMDAGAWRLSLRKEAARQGVDFGGLLPDLEDALYGLALDSLGRELKGTPPKSCIRRTALEKNIRKLEAARKK